MLLDFLVKLVVFECLGKGVESSNIGDSLLKIMDIDLIFDEGK
jgi:hypothetical protein